MLPAQSRPQHLTARQQRHAYDARSGAPPSCPAHPLPPQPPRLGSRSQPNEVLQRVVQICVISPGQVGRVRREWPGSDRKMAQAEQGNKDGGLLLRAAGRAGLSEDEAGLARRVSQRLHAAVVAEAAAVKAHLR